MGAGERGSGGKEGRREAGTGREKFERRESEEEQEKKGVKQAKKGRRGGLEGGKK